MDGLFCCSGKCILISRGRCGGVSHVRLRLRRERHTYKVPNLTHMLSGATICFTT